MALWKRLHRLLQDPPPSHIFELTEAGIAFAEQGSAAKVGFRPLEGNVLAVSPVKDNVLRPDSLAAEVRALAPLNGNDRRRAALILPDYCARVAVLDFDAFPSEPEQQRSLVRFRVKKSVPFDLDSAAVSYEVQTQGGSGRKYEVVVAVAALEIVARYEAPFRTAGFLPGYVTTSTLALRELLPATGVTLTAKLSGRVLSVLVTDGRALKMMRCVELADQDPNEIMAVLYPTFAYIEDELKTRPQGLLLCGLNELSQEVRQQAQRELGVPIEPLRSRFGAPGQHNAGLLGYLQTVGAN